MSSRELEVLQRLRINYVEGPEDVWSPSTFHVEGLNRTVERAILSGLDDVATGGATSPIGLVLRGQRGSGKTHLLGWVRERIQQDGGYFFLISLLDARTFWESTLFAMLDGLSRNGAEGESQLKILLRRLSELTDMPRGVHREVIGNRTVTRESLDALVNGVRTLNSHVGKDTKDTLRALVLYAGADYDAQDVGEGFLRALREEEPDGRAAWGIRQLPKTPQEIVKDISRLLALTGPSVIAVDQLDVLVAHSPLGTDGTAAHDWHDLIMIDQVAGGLMALREATRRTLTIVSSLQQTWTLIETYAIDTARDRFRVMPDLKPIPDAESARALVEKRFAPRFAEVSFAPPYPTWPVRPSAFDEASEYTPRQLLIRIDEHIDACQENQEVRELEHLSQIVDRKPLPPVPVPPPAFADLDSRFADLKRQTPTDDALNATVEDAVMPALLAAGLSAWIDGLGEAGAQFSVDPPPSSKPPLHARLRRTLNEETEDEEHWAFRAIAATHHIAALSRLRAASVTAGLNAQVSRRRLFVLRNVAWTQGPKTIAAVAEFEKAGGRVLTVDEEDLRVLAALRQLYADNPPNLRAWLAVRHPARDVKLLREALGDTLPETETETEIDAGPYPTSDPAPETVQPVTPEPTGQPPYVPLGSTVTGGRPVSVDLEALRKHTVIFAGSGSGKTVLIRRLVEECALRGVSAIVLDPNNDLARLGDSWPEPPQGWGPGDEAKAAEYLAATDVVVWTPRRTAGRPLSFQPLPDFASVAADPDEFGVAVDAAVAALAPRAKLTTKTAKTEVGLAVLREALVYYGRGGGVGMPGLIELLADLPYGVSELANAGKVAAELAQTLMAAMVNDPLFAGDGTPVDPGVLLTPPPGKRARVSVISFVGLPSDEQRQSFVNQLQMALFAWIRRNPAGDRPLGGLFVMDEAQTFAPSGGMTACTRSTLALATQARKYGLGLVFATQAPKGLHNWIPGNAATQFFGLLNSPAQIEAVKEMARSKGGAVTDVSRLTTGQFYLAAEGTPFAKTLVPLCLSHHPKAPLTAEEVITRANP
ncbi:ATP-binding protein [Streptosporangium saharense]|uniref:ATP-binding protein n=1 Tax=Streptosporangium saharense TaxID=1706840 RepID=UPI00368D07BE